MVLQQEMDSQGSDKKTKTNDRDKEHLLKKEQRTKPVQWSFMCFWLSIIKTGAHCYDVTACSWIITHPVLSFGSSCLSIPDDFLSDSGLLDMSSSVSGALPSVHRVIISQSRAADVSSVSACTLPWSKPLMFCGLLRRLELALHGFFAAERRAGVLRL